MEVSKGLVVIDDRGDEGVAASKLSAVSCVLLQQGKLCTIVFH